MSILQFRGIFIDGSHWHDLQGHITGSHPHPREYQLEVLAVLLTVWANPIGRIVIARLTAGAHGHHVTIVPYRGPLNAGTNAVNGHGQSTHASWRAAIPAGEPVRASDGTVLPSWGTGTGAGANVLVTFTPGIYRNLTGAGNDPASTLCHELFHAIRQTRGQLNNLARGGNFDNREEVYSVMIHDIFVSASQGSGLLRTSHASSPQLGAGQEPFEWLANFNLNEAPGSHSLADAFLNAHLADILLVIKEDPDVCQLIAQVPCGFNPVARAFVAPGGGPRFAPGLLPPPPAMPAP